MSEYADIEDFKYEGAPPGRRMSLRDRAAQFAPFAALTGYSDAISEAESIESERFNSKSDDDFTDYQPEEWYD